MTNIVGNRKLIILSVTPKEFFLESEGSESDIRTVIEKMVPNNEFTLTPLRSSDSAVLQGRLKQQQTEVLQKFRDQKPSLGGTADYRVQFNSPPSQGTSKVEAGAEALTDRQLEAVAAGALFYTNFNPNLQLISRPLPGGPGPIGVTVGVGISGKF